MWDRFYPHDWNPHWPSHHGYSHLPGFIPFRYLGSEDQPSFAQEWKKGSLEYSRKHQEMLQEITCMIIRLPSSPWPLKDTYHYHLGWRRVLGGYPDCSSSSLHARFFPVRANDGVWPDYVRLLNSYQLNEFASCFYILFLPLVWDNVVNRKNTEKYTEQIHHARVFGL